MLKNPCCHSVMLMISAPQFFEYIVEDHHWYDVNVLVCVCGLVTCS